MSNPNPKLVAAYTPPPSGNVFYPPYINVSRTGDYDNEIAVSLRGDEGDDKSCGKTVTATFTKEQFALFLIQCVKSL